MPVSMKVLRSDKSSFRFCRSVSRAKAASRLFWFFRAAARCVLLQSRLGTLFGSEAIAQPRVFGFADRRLGIFNLGEVGQRAHLRRSRFTSLSVLLFAVMSYAVAGAQTATTTTLSVNPSSVLNGNVVTLTAKVKAGAASLGVGTVTFRDTYGSVTQVLGTVQVQSANGTKGNAVLVQQIGGIGTHSIVATFNA